MNSKSRATACAIELENVAVIGASTSPVKVLERDLNCHVNSFLCSGY